jgi:hypothetical protein
MGERTYEIIRHESGDFSVIVNEEDVVKQMKRFASTSEAESWIQIQKEGWNTDPSPLVELSRAARFDRLGRVHTVH